MKCDWNASDDVGGTVKLRDSSTGEAYDFEITSIHEENGIKYARIEYPEENQEKRPFPSRFKGTATYQVGTGDQVQGENLYGVTNPTAAQCAHLGKGAELVADIPQISATKEDGVYKYPETPYKTTFHHENTCVFRVTFKSPAAVNSTGTKLRIYANGLDLLGEVTLDFTLSANAFCTAYVRCTTVTQPELSQNTEAPHTQATPIEMLSFVFDPPTVVGKSYVCRRFYSKIKENGIKKGTNGLESGYIVFLVEEFHP